MKKNLLLSALAIFSYGMFFTSCNKIASAIGPISWTGIDVTVTIPPVTDTLLHGSIGTGTFTYNIDSFIKAKTNNAVGLSNISQFKFTSCTMTIQNPDALDNFQNFQLAEAVFNTNVNTTSANMGEIDNNPNTYAASLSLPVNSTVNLKSYIGSGSTTINYVIGGKLRAPTTTTLTINMHVEYSISF